MLESQATLKKGPAADLMSVFPEFYVNKYRKAHYTRLSWAATADRENLLYSATRIVSQYALSDLKEL